MESSISTPNSNARHFRVSGMLVEMSLVDLVRRSSLIIRGRVEAPELSHLVSMDGEGRFPMVFTRHRVSITRRLKGRLGSTNLREIIVATMGGTSDGVTIEVDSEARLSRGEEVYLFLTQQFRLPEDDYSVLGGYQGKYRIIERDGTSMVSNGVSPLEPLDQFSGRMVEAAQEAGRRHYEDWKRRHPEEQPEEQIFFEEL